MMMKHPLMKMAGHAAWFITAAAAICKGLRVLNIRIDEMDFMMNHPMLQTILYIVIGVAGVYSMLMFVMWAGKGGCGCGCTCNSCKSEQ